MQVGGTLFLPSCQKGSLPVPGYHSVGSQCALQLAVTAACPLAWLWYWTYGARSVLEPSQYGGTVGMYCPVQYRPQTEQSIHAFIRAFELHGTSTVLYCLASPTGHPHSSRTLAPLAVVLHSVQQSRGDGSNAASHRPCGPNEPKPKPSGWSKRGKTRGGFHHRCRPRIVASLLAGRPAGTSVDDDLLWLTVVSE